ncbi:MAG: hypothetical protein O2979_10690, partial [Proteobacteria bacterium]|nr:hypothetical protein [Pseudomonadota bacterium]
MALAAAPWGLRGLRDLPDTLRQLAQPLAELHQRAARGAAAERLGLRCDLREQVGGLCHLRRGAAHLVHAFRRDAHAPADVLDHRERRLHRLAPLHRRGHRRAREIRGLVGARREVVDGARHAQSAQAIERVVQRGSGGVGDFTPHRGTHGEVTRGEALQVAAQLLDRFEAALVVAAQHHQAPRGAFALAAPV